MLLLEPSPWKREKSILFHTLCCAFLSIRAFIGTKVNSIMNSTCRLKHALCHSAVIISRVRITTLFLVVVVVYTIAIQLFRSQFVPHNFACMCEYCPCMYYNFNAIFWSMNCFKSNNSPVCIGNLFSQILPFAAHFANHCMMYLPCNFNNLKCILWHFSDLCFLAIFETKQIRIHHKSENNAFSPRISMCNV